MKALAWSCLAALYLLLPAVSNAQKTGRIECARNDGYVYLYSSMTTLDVRATLPCGATVQITGRFEFYYGVISAKGDPGFVPLSTVVLLKDRPGSGPATPDAPARERMHYDEPAAETTTPKNPGVAPFTLVRDTPIHVKLTKTLPGMRDGQFALVRYDSAFAHKVAAVESVTLVSESSAWSVVAYSIN